MNGDKERADFLLWQLRRTLSLLSAPDFRDLEEGEDYDRALAGWAREARRNLEWALEHLEEDEPQPPRPVEGPGPIDDSEYR